MKEFIEILLKAVEQGKYAISGFVNSTNVLLGIEIPNTVDVPATFINIRVELTKKENGEIIELSPCKQFVKECTTETNKVRFIYTDFINLKTAYTINGIK